MLWLAEGGGKWVGIVGRLWGARAWRGGAALAVEREGGAPFEWSKLGRREGGFQAVVQSPQVRNNELKFEFGWWIR